MRTSDAFFLDERDRLRDQVKELDRVAKMLIQRDLELSRVRTQQEDQIRELERVSQTLVRRDFELTGAKERLERLNREKSEFLSIVAHQLRTPLTGIKWPLSVLLRRGEAQGFGEREMTLVHQSLFSVERMIALVNDFLSVARIEEGRMGYEPRLYDIRSLVQEAAGSFSQRAREKNIQLTFSADSSVPREVVCDREKLLMVLENLLDNAVKYTLRGGAVSCSLALREGAVLFSFADTGIGIPADETYKLFRKFSMASNAITYEGGKGTGLGLYLAKNIVEAHGGRIWFESIEGKGSTFFFTLPRVG